MSDASVNPNSQMDSEIETVAGKVGRVADLVDSLQSRLASVTRDEGAPPRAGEENKPEQVLVPYAQRLRVASNTATQIIDKLEHILTILEV